MDPCTPVFFGTVHGVAQSRVRDPERLQTSASAPHPSGEKLRSQDSLTIHSPKRAIASAAVRPDIIGSISPLRPHFSCHSRIPPSPGVRACACTSRHRRLCPPASSVRSRSQTCTRVSTVARTVARQHLRVRTPAFPSDSRRYDTQPLAHSCSHYPNIPSTFMRSPQRPLHKGNAHPTFPC
jgi:hypothetical protein